MNELPLAHFDGPDYEPRFDYSRLTGQIRDVYTLMSDGEWRTLREVADITAWPEASISAQLRHLRKPKFGSHKVEKRRRGDPSNGLYEYRLSDSGGAS
jgi:hypothetical protein